MNRIGTVLTGRGKLIKRTLFDAYGGDGQMRKSPCKDCPDREPGCHAKCEKYQTWRHELDQVRAWLRDQMPDTSESTRKALTEKMKRKARGYRRRKDGGED